MAYAFIDDWLYLDINDKVEVYGRQEMERNLKGKINEARVAFLDCQSKVLTLTDKRSGFQETLINTSFQDDYILTQERISENIIQVIAAKKEKIQEIYQYFKGINVQSLVPYPVAVRATLRSKGLLETDKIVIFLDDLKNQAVLTVFEGMVFNSPRRINLRDASYMISEIKRSMNNYLVERSNKQHEGEQSFILVCNNQKWISDFIDHDFLNLESIVHLDVPFVVLEGLKKAKFSVHFALAQEVLKQKKHQLWCSRLKYLVSGFLLIFLGLGFYLEVSNLKAKELKEYQYFDVQKEQIEKELKLAYQEKFGSFLIRKGSLDYAHIYYDFVRSIPSDYLVDSIQFHKVSDESWEFQGCIYPMNDKVQRVNFFQRGFFKESKISCFIVQKVLGQKIGLTLKVKDQAS